jgi:hypothetical protein
MFFAGGCAPSPVIVEGNHSPMLSPAQLQALLGAAPPAPFALAAIHSNITFSLHSIPPINFPYPSCQFTFLCTFLISFHNHPVFTFFSLHVSSLYIFMSLYFYTFTLSPHYFFLFIQLSIFLCFQSLAFHVFTFSHFHVFSLFMFLPYFFFHV